MSGQSEANHPVMISLAGRILLAGFCVLFGTAAQAATSCTRDVTANIVAMDQPVLFNRLGASNVNGMIFALARDVVAINAVGEVVTAGPNLTSNTTAMGNDIQVIPVGETVQQAGQIVVDGGADGLDPLTVAGGDDVVTNIGVGATAPVPTDNLAAFVGNVALRPDKRPRPLVLRIREGDCLIINLTNLLTPEANPIKPAVAGGDPLPGNDGRPNGPNAPDAIPIDGINAPIDDQVLDRHVSFHVAGMQWVNGPADDSSFVGTNADSTVAQGGFRSHKLYAEQEGVFVARGMATTVGSDANQGNASNLLFGQVIVEPIGARIYRSQTTEEEMRLASMNLDTTDILDDDNGVCGDRNLTPDGQPIIDYEASYPTANCDAVNEVLQCANESAPVDEITADADGTAATTANPLEDDVQVVIVGDPVLAGQVVVTAGPDGTLQTIPAAGESVTVACEDSSTPALVNIGGTGVDLGAAVWVEEGKAGLPILNMICDDSVPGLCVANEIVHSEIHGLIVGPDDDGSWRDKCPGTDCPYPLESIGKRNPVLPNRLEPFRDFASIWHDEPAAAQAFPGFYKTDPVFRYVLAGVKDGFMINYGSGGIGSEIIANRLGVGPMHDCLTCAYEEFFLTSYTVGDVAQLSDVAANMGLEQLLPGAAPPAGTTGPKATYVPYPEDPSNVHHSYVGDFTKFRNTHVGQEQHVFHLHNHQWLYNANDDNSNYLDAQGIGPGAGYTYEINFGGSGNRIKSAGDAIFHCHFYPHFAQGMWYMWRNHDVMETGTLLEASGAPDTFHTVRWALENGTPMLASTAGLDISETDPLARVRSLPDGEIVAGAPIPALIPLPGKAMAPMPGEVQVVPNSLTKTASMFHPLSPGLPVPVGSLARVKRDNLVPDPDPACEEPCDMVEAIIHPGYPFWIAGIEDIVGQRPPTPPLDMANSADILSLPNTVVDVFRADGEVADTVKNLFGLLDPDQADGWDGGLPRTALQGYAAGGSTQANVVSPIDFSKVLGEAQAVFYPEEGTDVEQVSMAYHAIREHASFAVDMTGDDYPEEFVLNGVKPAVGAPYHEPCLDDQGDRFDTFDDIFGEEGDVGHVFFGGDPDTFDPADDERVFDADNPRIYKGVNIQYDAVLNKAGYHYPQQRIISLWEDAVPIITKAKAAEPMVLRFNTFECGVYHHSNLVPENYELDDYQVRTPTDIIGQHIHLPKWDLTTADGAANGWNYEDGTLSPGAVYERIQALNEYIATATLRCDDGNLPAAGVCADGSTAAAQTHTTAVGSTTAVPDEFADGIAQAKEHPYFKTQLPPGGLADKWMGARTTTQRWFFDPVVNSDGIDRGLGIIFTHDHYGPSTHQQVGLYATVLTEPSKSKWYQNETGEQLGCRNPGEQPAAFGLGGVCRKDGGPTSWQAVIEPDPDGSAFNPEGQLEPYREFYFEYSDFQHAYEAGVYVGADQNGEALAGTGPGLPMAVDDLGNPANCDDAANAFRCSINPPAREEIQGATFPDLYEEIAGGVEIYCPTRPCPQAIDVEDPGMFVVNYRNEPVALRVYDPNKLGPDGLPGTQADGAAGDLAFALASSDDNGQDIVRMFEVEDWNGTLPPGSAPGGPFKVLNIQPKAGNSIYGTVFPPPINEFAALKGGDPFTPMVRTMAGDRVRIKMQAGGDEEEHTATIHGMKWLQAGSAHGGAPNSGWRNAQPGAISEQFTLNAPIVGIVGQIGNSVDYAYSMDTSMDGWWSGMWGLMRVYSNKQNNLMMLSTSPYASNNNVKIDNDDEFVGACPAEMVGKGKSKTKTIINPRAYNVTAVLANDILGKPVGLAIPVDPHPTGHVGGAPDPAGGTLVYNSRSGGAEASLLHDPTAILYVRTEDMVDPDDPTAGLNPGVPVEPLILRANAGDCIQVTLRNKLLDPAVTANDVTVLLADGITEVTVLAGAPVFDANGAEAFLNDGDALFVFVPGGADSCVGANDCAEIVDPLNDVAFDQMPELATFATLLGANKRDREGVDGATTFQTNLIQASAYVGLHAQLVEFDGSKDNGVLAGKNTNTNNKTIVPPGQETTYQWYAGDLDIGVTGGRRPNFELTATAVEFGGSNLQPADVIKQGMKSLVGQLVIEPKDSEWPEDDRDGSTVLSELELRLGVDPNADPNNGHRTEVLALGGRKTRAMVDVCEPTAFGSCVFFRDLSTIWTKGLTHYYASSEPVEHMNGEGNGIPEDPQDGTGMAINYGVEPVWFRLGILPSAPFGNAGSGATTFGGNEQFDVFSNGKVSADPQTPVFWAPPGMPTRMRVTVPHGTNRGSTFALHGHLWQRDPYITENNSNGFPDSDPGVGSKDIGHNPLAFYQGGQESIWPATHYDIVLPSAGGCAETDDGDGSCIGKPGDYMFRDVAAFGSASGLWGILNVDAERPPPAREPPPPPPPDP